MSLGRVCDQCPILASLSSCSAAGAPSLPHPQEPSRGLQSGLGLPHLSHLPETFFSDLLSSPVSWPVGYPGLSFGPSVGTNQWLLLWKMSDEDLSRRALGNSAPASATRPLFLGIELELSTPRPQSDTTDPMLCKHHQCPFFSEHCSLLLHVFLCSVDKSCLTLATPWTVASQAPLSMGFSRQEYWRGLPLPLPVHLLDPGIKAASHVSFVLIGVFFFPLHLLGAHVRLHSATSLPPLATPCQMKSP